MNKDWIYWHRVCAFSHYSRWASWADVCYATRFGVQQPWELLCRRPQELTWWLVPWTDRRLEKTRSVLKRDLLDPLSTPAGSCFCSSLKVQGDFSRTCQASNGTAPSWWWFSCWAAMDDNRSLQYAALLCADKGCFSLEILSGANHSTNCEVCLSLSKHRSLRLLCSVCCT